MGYSATDTTGYTNPAPLLRHATRRPCDVCLLVDGDATPKLVEFCNMCQAWICDACKHNWARRMQAFFATRRRRA